MMCPLYQMKVNNAACVNSNIRTDGCLLKLDSMLATTRGQSMSIQKPKLLFKDSVLSIDRNLLKSKVQLPGVTLLSLPHAPVACFQCTVIEPHPPGTWLLGSTATARATFGSEVDVVTGVVAVAAPG
jgi:hypothetical protein